MLTGHSPAHPTVRTFSSAPALLILGIGLCSGPLIAQSTPLAAGTTETYILTVHEVEFAPLDSSTTYEALDIAGVTDLRETTSGTVLVAPVHLPTGAIIDLIKLHACNTSAFNYGTVTLRDCADDGPPAACTTLGTVSTAFGGGCGYWTSAAIGATVHNHTDDYELRTDWPPDPHLGLRAVKVHYHLQVSPPPGIADFGDVPMSDPAFQFIEALFRSGITAGCGGGNYCPDSPVTRRQMAVFLAKGFGLNWPD
jgi:hypothetical protein